jgi:hypothetical protein
MQNNDPRERTLLTVYRIGAKYRLEPWNSGDIEAEPLVLALAGGVWGGESRSGEALLFSHRHTVGVGVNTAFALGLCQPLGAPAAEFAQQAREHRAADQEAALLRVSRLLAAIAAAAVAGDPLANAVVRPSGAATLEALVEHFEASAQR